MLQWDSSAASRARLAHMHGKKRFTSMTQLREDTEYVQALHAIGTIGSTDGTETELPF